MREQTQPIPARSRLVPDRFRAALDHVIEPQAGRARRDPLRAASGRRYAGVGDLTDDIAAAYPRADPSMRSPAKVRALLLRNLNAGAQAAAQAHAGPRPLAAAYRGHQRFCALVS